MTDYIVIQQQIIGSPESYEFVYSWDGMRHASTDAAVRAGWREFDHDDFNVGRVDSTNRLVWFGWQYQELDDDLAEVARQIGLSA